MADDRRAFDRRRFLRDGVAAAAGLAAAPLVASLAACGGPGRASRPDASLIVADIGQPVDADGPDAVAPVDPGPEAAPKDPGPADPGAADESGAADVPPAPAGPDDVVFALYGTDAAATPEAAVRLACQRLDFSWLAPGDWVFLKLACNSGKPHPATTSPAAVRAMVAELFARGAGRVLAGDQAGVENVRLTEQNLRYSSTADRMKTAGLYDAIVQSGAEPVFFDDAGWDGYFEATPPDGSHWMKPMWVAKAVRDVDHVVYLPRLSSHGICGYTHGLKCSIGWLREDARHHFHQDGTTLYDRFVEVNYCREIRDRFRMVVTLAEKVLLDFGPDDGTVIPADPPIVLASRNLANHDAVSVGVSVWLDQAWPAAPGVVPYSPDTADSFNTLLLTVMVESATGMPWDYPDAPYAAVIPSRFEQGLSSDRALARAWQLQGGRPAAIRVERLGRPMDPALEAFLVQHGEGTLWLG